jgi:hypothetical protein
MLINTQINGLNIQVDFKEGNKLWGISFVNSSDNSTELALIKEHATDEEYAQIIEAIKE